MPKGRASDGQLIEDSGFGMCGIVVSRHWPLETVALIECDMSMPTCSVTPRAALLVAGFDASAFSERRKARCSRRRSAFSTYDSA